MENKELLNEEKYQNTKGKISKVAFIIIGVGFLIGLSLIGTGIYNNIKINERYSDKNIAKVEKQIEEEKAVLVARQKELADKGVTYDRSADYTDGDAYEYKIIYNVLDPSYDRCKYDEYKNNSTTKKYCSLKEELEEISSDFNKSFDSHDSIPFFMFGAFIMIASCMMGGFVFTISKRREMLAFSVQQVMPVAQEGMEKMEPTLSKVGSRMMKNMAPAYGEMAKEISKGIKEGLKEMNNNDSDKE